MPYNRFGATAAELLALYPASQASDYGRAAGVPDATTGTAAINDALDRYARKAAACLTESAYGAITKPRGEVLKEHTTGSETSLTTVFAPIVSGSFHLWEFARVPQRTPRFDDAEVAASEYTVDYSTGVVTYSPVADIAVVASYDIDTDSASYSVQSMKEWVLIGAAAELGARLYFGDTQRWGLVERYQSMWDTWCADARAGNWLPDEVRLAQYAVEPAGGTAVGSVFFSRG